MDSRCSSSWLRDGLLCFLLVNITFCGYRVKRFVAMKVVKSAEHYTETALDEIKLLRSVSIRFNCMQ